MHLRLPALTRRARALRALDAELHLAHVALVGARQEAASPVGVARLQRQLDWLVRLRAGDPRDPAGLALDAHRVRLEAARLPRPGPPRVNEQLWRRRVSRIWARGPDETWW